MRDFPYYQQPNGSRDCGTACLCMVYTYFGIDHNFDDIHRSISWFRSCRNNKMVLDALSHGLNTVCVSCNSLENTIHFCFEHKLEVIVLTHPNINSNEGHFRVVADIDKYSAFLHDPNKGSRNGRYVRVRFQKLKELARTYGKNDEILASNTLIILGKKDNNNVSVSLLSSTDTSLAFPIFNDLLPFCDYILDPYIDDWIQADTINV